MKTNMKTLTLVLTLFATALFPKPDSAQEIPCKKHAFEYMPSRNHNICKSLTGDVLLYVIYVDDKNAGKWSDFDIELSIDSLKASIDWLEDRATDEGKELNMRLGAYSTDSSRSIDFSMENTLYRMLNHKNQKRALRKINRWSDALTKKMGYASKEELVGELRERHHVQSIALVYMLNNIYKYDHSVALNTGSNTKLEYAVLTSRSCCVIVHELMHLFGAMDLYTPKQRRRFISKKFPNEVMLNNYPSLAKTQISPVTKYLLCWAGGLEKEYCKVFRYGTSKHKSRGKRRKKRFRRRR